MIDHREFFLVGYVCDSGINGVERAYVADVGGILIVSTFEPFVSFMHVCQIIWLCTICWCALTFPYELIGSGHAVLPRKRALVQPIEENGLYVFINMKITQNQQGDLTAIIKTLLLFAAATAACIPAK